MSEPTDFPERRKDHITRALFTRLRKLEERCDSLAELNADLSRDIAVLKESHVSKGWLVSGVLSIAIAGAGGLHVFLKGLEEKAAKPLMAQAEEIGRQGRRLEAFIERQAATNIKTEVMYLRDIEGKSREEARAIVRQTAKEK
jgi:hypothetical protein